MAGQQGIRIKARIELFGPGRGGRSLPIRGSFRASHNFGDSDNREMDSGVLEFASGEFLMPGQSKEMELTLAMRPDLEEVLKPGREWRIQEGHRHIGRGVVLQVLQRTGR